LRIGWSKNESDIVNSSLINDDCYEGLDILV
jgi:hypothetical protein